MVGAMPDHMKTAPSVEQKARILVECGEDGVQTVAKRNGMNRQTISRWRKDMLVEPELAAKVQQLLERREAAWAKERTAALNALTRRITKLAATEKDMDKLSKAVERLGGVDVAGRLLKDAGAQSDPEDAGGSGPSTGAGEGEPRVPH